MYMAGVAVVWLVAFIPVMRCFDAHRSHRGLGTVLGPVVSKYSANLEYIQILMTCRLEEHSHIAAQLGDG